MAATSGAAAGRWGGLAGVATTSGTAVANLHPAVMEAAEARLPLIAISADRPAELHGVGANQTTDQRGVFGAAPVWARTLPAGLDPALAQAAGLAAAAAAVGERSGLPGPAHLNIQFREPLVPQPGWWPAPGGPGAAPPPGAGPPLGPVGAPGAGGAPPPGPAGGLANQAAQLLPAALERGPKTLVLAGFGAGPAAAELALAAGWPLVADPASGAWWGPNCVPAGRLAADLLGSQVERVVVYGRPVLSRPVARLAQQPGLETVIVHPGGGPWFDLGRVARRVASAALAPSGPPTGQERAWLDRWLQAGRAAWARVAARPFPSGPAIAACVAQAAGAGRLVVGASSAIRDLDLVPAPAGPSGLVAAMRGAAGIDGTISFAAGLDLAAPGPGPTRVLLGDLALAHDSGGLLLPTSETRPNLQVIVLQDGGGGIFETLEVAGPGLEAAFERFFATPVQLEVKALARACGAAFAEVSTERDLVAALACPPAGISLVSVRLPRAARRGADADAVRLSRNDLILPSELS
ncbi:MAG: hypothetical protein LBD51_03420 [Bifidobacteriaceae bacterium]|nr:hypothetical protein [Bifidobacteriaceae bacterium]